MKSLLLLSVIIVNIFLLSVSSDVFSPGPVLVVRFQLSQIVASGENSYVVYQENGPGPEGHVYFRKSSDAGANFDNIIRLDENGYASFPKVAVSGNNVYVAWTEYLLDTGLSQVLFRKSVDGGKTFGSPTPLSKNDGSYYVSQLVAIENNVYVVLWADFL